MKPSLKIAMIALSAKDDKEFNVNHAFSQITSAAKKGADWVFLPEVFTYHGSYNRLWEAAEEENGPLTKALSDLAKSLNIVIFAGTVPERAAPEVSEKPTPTTTSSKKMVYNTQYVFGRDGELLAKYRKIHLFNLFDASNKPLYCESDGFLAGDEAVTLTVDGWKVGLATCYDLRFPKIFEKLHAQGPRDLIALPSAFTFQTGSYHWHTLNRARAIEGLCYVVATNQVGEHSVGKSSYGHSLAVDPWGTVIADQGRDTGICFATLQMSAIKKAREQLPVHQNAKSDFELRSLMKSQTKSDVNA